MKTEAPEKGAAEIYESFRRGDKAAFETLVITYRQSLMLFINRYVNDMDTAEDLAEDVFVRLLIKKPKYKGDASFKTWLFTIGRNLSVDYLRKQRRTYPTEEPQSNADDKVEDAFFLTESKRTIYRALDTLPKEERLLMHLVYIEDLGYDHAEKVLNISKSKLYTIARRAKEKLKNELIKEGVEF